MPLRSPLSLVPLLPRVLVVFVVLVATGCPGDGQDACFFGDKAGTPELEIVLRSVDGTVVVATEGGTASLMKPPQGGKVLFVGARARNLNGCGLQATGSLRDECTNRLFGLVSQPVNLTAAGDGWGEPEAPVDISNWVNLAACPHAGADRDVEGEPYRLELSVRDKQGRTATASLHVVPTCAEPELENECRCECDGQYVLGEPCMAEPDGGPVPGMCPSAIDGGVAP